MCVLDGEEVPVTELFLNPDWDKDDECRATLEVMCEVRDEEAVDGSWVEPVTEERTVDPREDGTPEDETPEDETPEEETTEEETTEEAEECPRARVEALLKEETPPELAEDVTELWVVLRTIREVLDAPLPGATG